MKCVPFQIIPAALLLDHAPLLSEKAEAMKEGADNDGWG